MQNDEALKLLKAHKATLAKRFGVTGLALFGSTVRDAACPESDIDILVAFDGPATSKRYFGVQFYLEDLLGCPVDLVTEKALRPELRPYIEREADPKKDKREWRFNLDDMIAFAQIQTYTTGLDRPVSSPTDLLTTPLCAT